MVGPLNAKPAYVMLNNIKSITKTRNLKNTKFLKTLEAGRGESLTVRNSFYFGFVVHGLFRGFDLS